MIKKILLVSVVVMAITVLKGQSLEWQPLTREIVVDQGDSILRFRVLIKQDQIKVYSNRDYYWHNKGQINKNQGDYAGELLHGDYQVFDADKKLITKGQFDSGLKTGTWKKWNSEGITIRIENYSKGLLNGTLQIFDNLGNLIEERDYHDGNLVQSDNKTFKIFKSEEKADTAQISEEKPALFKLRKEKVDKEESSEEKTEEQPVNNTRRPRRTN